MQPKSHKREFKQLFELGRIGASVIPDLPPLAVRNELGVLLGDGNGPMAQIVLDPTRGMPLVDQVEAAAMAEHVGVDRDRRVTGPAGSSQELEERGPTPRPPTLVLEQEGLGAGILGLLDQPVEGSDLSAPRDRGCLTSTP